MKRSTWILIGVVSIIFVVVCVWKVPARNTRISGMNGVAGIMNVTTNKQSAMIATDEMALSAPTMAIAYPQPPYEEGGSTGVISPEMDRLMIQSAELSILVESVELQAHGVARIAEEKKGFIVSSQVYNLNTIPQATVMIRVPAVEFEGVLGELRTFGQVTSESVNGQDVTAEYVDLDAELKNLRATEAQFLEIMKKAQRIEDVLAVQRELTNTRSSIERIEGRMKYLSESAEYSTIMVYLSSDAGSLPILTEGDEWKPVRVFKDALRSLVDLGKGLLSGIIWLTVYAPVWVTLGIIVWLVVRKLKRKS